MARRYWVEVAGRRYDVPGGLRELRKAAKALANRFRADVRAGYDNVRPRRPARRTLKRNPVMRGHDFTGEEWTTVGFGPRGRLAMISESRAAAERDAAYLHAMGYRALTTRRTKAPVSAQGGLKRRAAAR